MIFSGTWRPWAAYKREYTESEMQGPNLPPPFDDIGRRQFSFYPSITNAEPNEWLLRNANWSEVQVVNSRTRQEIWIPRQYVGCISETDDPLLIVDLTKELEFREGAVWPRVKRVIEMPLAANGNANEARLKPWLRSAREERTTPAPVIGIRLEDSAASKKGRVAAYLGVGAALLSLLVVVVFRDWVFAPHVTAAPASEARLGLTGSDDYAAVIRVLGQPATDTWYPARSLPLCALTYPQRDLMVILTGPDREHLRYAGAVDLRRRVIDRAAPIHGRPGSAAALANLPIF
jgi:hypothetical protein